MGQKLMSRGGGFGESKQTNTVGPDAFDHFDDGLPPKEDWTWGGKHTSEMQNVHLLPWETTDQSIQMRVDLQIARNLERGGTLSIGRGQDDKNDDARKARFDEYNSREATKFLDYKTVLREKHGREGHAHMYVPADQVDEYRGQDGFEPILNDKGDPVKYKDQILTSRPKEIQAASNRRDEEESRRQISTMTGSQKESMNRQLRDANVSSSHIPAEDFGLQDDYGV